MQATEHTRKHLLETERIAPTLDAEAVDSIVYLLRETRDRGGRIFFLGVGGSAANASHATNDFRKIADIECYSVTDNVSELTARINDDGWDSSYARWLSVSRLSAADAILVLSVSGGNEQRPASVNLVEAVRLARKVGAKVYAILGEDGGYTGTVADACVMVPVAEASMSIPQVEGFQALLWHLIVTHPALVASDTERLRPENSRPC